MEGGGAGGVEPATLKSLDGDAWTVLLVLLFIISYLDLYIVASCEPGGRVYVTCRPFSRSWGGRFFQT